jgi:hypothetical protein
MTPLTSKGVGLKNKKALFDWLEYMKVMQMSSSTVKYLPVKGLCGIVY